MTLRMSIPIATLIILVALGVTVEVILAYHGEAISESTSFLWDVCFAYCVVLWIEKDRKSKSISAPFEYQAFVFFFWPLVVPYYLFQTRGWSGLVQGIGLFAFACLPTIAALVTYFLLWEAT